MSEEPSDDELQNIKDYADHVTKTMNELNIPEDWHLELGFSINMFAWWERPLIRAGLLKDFNKTTLCRKIVKDQKNRNKS